MVLNKRERTTAIVVGSLLALLALYYIAIGPFLAYRGTLEKQRAKLVKDKNYYNRTISEATTAEIGRKT